MADDSQGTSGLTLSADDVLRRLDEVQRLAGMGYWEWDVPTRTISWSDGLYRLAGFEPDAFEPSGRAFLEVVHPDDRSLVDSTVRRAILNGAFYAIDHRIVRPDGVQRWWHSRGETHPDEHGVVVRMSGVVTDITDRVRGEEAIEDFIANAAHELRTPVTAISQAIDLMEMDGLDREIVKDAGRILRRQVDRLMRISHDLVDLSTVGHRSASVTLSSTDLSGTVADVIDEVDDGSVLFSSELPADLRVLAHAFDLRQVLLHVLDNAVTHGGDCVWVTAHAHADEVQLTIADDGAGVPASRVNELFSPFSRAGRSGTGGAGLGLAVAQRLMTGFGGTIEYHARPEGGAEFILRFLVG